MNRVKVSFSFLVTGLLFTVFLLTALSVMVLTGESVQTVVDQELELKAENLNNQSRLSINNILTYNAYILDRIAEESEGRDNLSDFLEGYLYQTNHHNFDYLIIKTVDGVQASALPVSFSISEELKELFTVPPLLEPQWEVFHEDGVVVLNYLIPLYDKKSGHQNRVLHGGIILNDNSEICEKIAVDAMVSNIAFSYQEKFISAVQKYDTLEMETVKAAADGEISSLVHQKYLIASQLFPLQSDSSLIVMSFIRAGTLVTMADDLRQDMVWIYIIFTFVAIASSILFMKLITQPVHRLTEYSKSLRTGDIISQLPGSRIKEIDELTTHLLRSVNEIHDKEKRLRNLSNNVPQSFVFQIESDVDGLNKKFIYLSEGVEQLQFITRVAILNNSSLLFDQIFSDDREKLFQSEMKALASMSSFSVEVRFTLPDGTVEWRQINSSPSISDDKILWDGIYIDITKRKHDEETLQTTLNNLKSILTAANQISIITTDLEGIITMWNPGSERMLGYSAEEMVGRNTSLIIHLESEIIERSKELSEEFNKTIDGFETFIYKSRIEEYEQLEWTYVRKDGVFLTVNLIVTAIRDKKNVITGYLGLAQDITQRKMAEAEKIKLTDQLHQSQKMDAIGQLAGGIAHDFNNMIGGILGAGELLKGDCSDERRFKYTDLIITAANRAGDLTKQLLAFSRKSPKVISSVSVDSIIQETVTLLERTIDKSIAITVRNEADDTNIDGDNYLLQNAFVNIGINASHAMPEGGSLIFTLSNILLDQNYCSVSPFDISPGKYIEIAVRDTGTGMSPDLQNKIFEPFFTTKEDGKGTGLGLSAVYGMVQEHNGAITVYSEEGTGTVFHIYIPVSAKGEENKNETILKIHGTGTILIIDDEELIRITAKEQLESLGYQVFIAENGLEGVEKFSQFKDQIDLIILDMIMPVMGGRETLINIRRINNDIPVLIASGFTKSNDLESLNEYGIKGFLSKPYRLSELAKAVDKSLA